MNMPAELAQQFAQIVVDGCAERDRMTPREAAEAAWHPGRADGLTVDQLEEVIRADRAAWLRHTRIS